MKQIQCVSSRPSASSPPWKGNFARRLCFWDCTQRRFSLMVHSCLVSFAVNPAASGDRRALTESRHPLPHPNILYFSFVPLGWWWLWGWSTDSRKNRRITNLGAPPSPKQNRSGRPGVEASVRGPVSLKDPKPIQRASWRMRGSPLRRMSSRTDIPA